MGLKEVSLIEEHIITVIEDAIDVRRVKSKTIEVCLLVWLAGRAIGNSKHLDEYNIREPFITEHITDADNDDEVEELPHIENAGFMCLPGTDELYEFESYESAYATLEEMYESIVAYSVNDAFERAVCRQLEIIDALDRAKDTAMVFTPEKISPAKWVIY